MHGFCTAEAGAKIRLEEKSHHGRRVEELFVRAVQAWLFDLTGVDVNQHIKHPF